jgi:hypothetical protein
LYLALPLFQGQDVSGRGFGLLFWPANRQLQGIRGWIYKTVISRTLATGDFLVSGKKPFNAA